MRDLRDPKLLGQALLKAARSEDLQEAPLSDIQDRLTSAGLLDVAHYSANPSCIEKYGRPQDLPETPF